MTIDMDFNSNNLDEPDDDDDEMDRQLDYTVNHFARDTIILNKSRNNNW